MRIAEVIGTVTLSRMIPEFEGATLRVVRPLSLANLLQQQPAAAEPLVAWDQQGAGLGDRIGLSEGGEAAQPFRPEMKPVDAYVALIIDQLDIRDLET